MGSGIYYILKAKSHEQEDEETYAEPVRYSTCSAYGNLQHTRNFHTQ
jgi:hypothetical protein